MRQSFVSTTDPGIYTLIVFDLVSGKALFTTHGNSGGISAVAYSPDGKHIVTSDVATAVIWDSTRGEKVLTLQPDSQAVLVSVAYSPDGKYIATGDVNGLGRIWNASTGKEALTLKGHNGWLNQFSFSPDGKLIATVAKDGTARLWDLSTGENLLTLPVDSKGAGGVSFSPDGKRLAVGAYSGIYIFALPIEDVIALAKSRLTRTLTTEACQQYLHMSVCPPMP